MTKPVIFRSGKTHITGPVRMQLKAQREQVERAAKAIEAANNPPGDKNLRGLVTAEAQNHSKYVSKVNHVGKRRAMNVTENVLDTYLHRGSLDENDSTKKAQECIAIGIMRHSAGMHLYKDFYASRLVSGFKSCLNVTVGGRTGVNSAGMNFAAYEAYQAAVASVHPRYRKIITTVCCAGEWLKDVKTTIPVYRRMDALTRALDDLIAHYENRIDPRKVSVSFHAAVTTTLGAP